MTSDPSPDVPASAPSPTRTMEKTRARLDDLRPHPRNPRKISPFELIERSLRATTHRGNSVYDPFAGSGSVLIAAERLGLRGLAVEIDPCYCDVIRQRYADYVGRPDLAP